MNDLVKRRRKTTFKYTWPIYIVSAVIAIAGMNLAFKVAHPTPAYKVLTLFLTGELKNRKELTSYIMQKYEDKQIKSFSCIEAKLFNTKNDTISTKSIPAIKTVKTW